MPRDGGSAPRYDPLAPLSPRRVTANPPSRPLMQLRRLALLCAVMVLAVTSLSAYIRLSKAGVGCVPWPQCYAQSAQQAKTGAAADGDDRTAYRAARLAHRVAAMLTLALVIGMLVICLGAKPALRAEAAMVVALLLLSLALAVLGRWSSGARVPAVAIGNLLGGFAMLALCARLVMARRAPPVPGLRGWVIGTALLLLAQVALGGLVSASHAALSCASGLDCFQAAQAIAWDTLNPWREPVLTGHAPFNAAGALAQALHRALGLALALLLLVLTVAAWRRGRPRTAALLLLVLGAQLIVGVALAQGTLPLSLALLHNVLATALLAALVLLI